MLNQCGNIYNVDYNQSISQVEISIHVVIIFGSVITFLLKRDISYSMDRQKN
jgi:hypothetical protein